MFDYWHRHKRNPGKALDEVNWEALGLAASTVPTTRLQWQVKQATNWLPHNVNKKKWNMIEQQQCSACNAQDDYIHMHQCIDHRMVKWRTKILESLVTRMTKQKTSQSIISAVLDGIWTVWKETPSKNSSQTLPGLSDAIISQNCIGWWALICGRWSSKWMEIQATYFQAIQSPRSSKKWQSSLIRLLWKTS